MSGGVPPSSRAGRRSSRSSASLSNATSALVRKAASLYERFSGHEAVEGERVQVEPLPKVAVNIGVVDGILYTTVRDGVREKYIHKFHPSDKPLFVVSPEGKRLFMIGGRYDFTERGIVDKSDKSR